VRVKFWDLGDDFCRFGGLEVDFWVCGMCVRGLVFLGLRISRVWVK
jgi:hypothetical protein